ncbi:Metaxin-2-like protein [Aphelenchoides bicaudatus]|nr:Metaxin-2-like protein [Aphelenchoides bicaudatus]
MLFNWDLLSGVLLISDSIRIIWQKGGKSGGGQSATTFGVQLECDCLKYSMTATSSAWTDAELYCPYQHEQALLYEFADCVSTRAFFKMVNLPFSLEQRPNSEYMSPNGVVPFLRMDSTLTAGFSEIVELVSQKGIKLTNTLSSSELTDMQALIALIKENLIRAEMYFCWNDKATYNLVTRLRYSSVHFFPLNLILAPLKRREVLAFLSDMGWQKLSIEAVVKKADACFHALSVKLGNNKYFTGDEPTELDALAFGHLYTILTTELPSMNLLNSLRKYPNLLKYAHNVDQSFFKD